MNHKDHYLINLIIFRQPFPEIHKWLDETYPETEKLKVSPYRHWVKRHNVETLKTRYGDQTIEFRAGCLHVLCDWLSHLDTWELPTNEAEVIEKLKENHAY